MQDRSDSSWHKEVVSLGGLGWGKGEVTILLGLGRGKGHTEGDDGRTHHYHNQVLVMALSAQLSTHYHSYSSRYKQIPSPTHHTITTSACYVHAPILRHTTHQKEQLKSCQQFSAILGVSCDVVPLETGLGCGFDVQSNQWGGRGDAKVFVLALMTCDGMSDGS